MILRIIAVGRLREKYWQDAAADFARRLRPYARLEMVEVSEAHIKEAASPAEEKKAMQEEALAILEKLKRHSGPVIALDRMGKALDSPRAGIQAAQDDPGRKDRDRLCDRRSPRPRAGGYAEGGPSSLLFQNDLPPSDDENNSSGADL